MPRRFSTPCSGTSATERWHCQGFPALGGSPPSNNGSARDSWLGAGLRHPVLALPGFSGIGRVLATGGWQCQGFLASGGSSPLGAGAERACGEPLRPPPIANYLSAGSIMTAVPVAEAQTIVFATTYVSKETPITAFAPAIAASCNSLRYAPLFACSAVRG